MPLPALRVRCVLRPLQLPARRPIARMTRAAAGPLATRPCELERLFGDNQPMVLEVIEGDPATSPSAHIRLFGFERSA